MQLKHDNHCHNNYALSLTSSNAHGQMVVMRELTTCLYLEIQLQMIHILRPRYKY